MNKTINYNRYIKIKIIEDKNNVIHEQDFNTKEITIFKGSSLDIINQLLKSDKYFCLISKDILEMLDKV